MHNKDLQAEHSRDLKLVVVDRQMMDPQDLPLQQALVVHRLHQHSIHSSDSHRQLLQVTDPQAVDQIMGPLPQQALDQIMAPLPQQAPDQIMDPDPQLVTQVHSDEASLTSLPRPLLVHKDPQQIMLMEVPLKHHRYSVVSLQPHPLVDRRDQVDNKDLLAEHSRDQAHLMVRLL